MDGLRSKIEPGDRNFKRAHANLESGTDAATS
jgi:hypothetical protein